MSYSYTNSFSYFGGSSSIPQTTLGKTDLQIGRLGIGTWELGDQKVSVKTTKQLLATMLDAGGNLIDTSDNYSGAESILGQALRGFNRDDFVIVTKCGDYTKMTFDPATGLSTNHPDFKHQHLNFTAPVIKKNVEDSLKLLGVDYLDVLLIHTAYLESMRKGEVIDATIQAQKEGKVRYVGYSGDNAELLYSIQVPEFEVVELSLSITDMRNAMIPLKAIKERGMGIIVKRPIANAFWRGKDLYQTAFGYSKEYRQRAKKMGLRPSDFGLPNNNAGWIELSLAFTMSFPVDNLAIGTTRLDHMQQNIEVVSRIGNRANHRLVNKVMDKFDAAQDQIGNYADGKAWLGLE